jgi:hypothetical protein
MKYKITAKESEEQTNYSPDINDSKNAQYTYTK